jgi:hypothetical protein
MTTSVHLSRLGLLAALAIGVLGCREDVAAPATQEVETAAVTATAVLSFRQIAASDHHSCGIALDDHVYCWGANFLGQLGDGTLTPHSQPARFAHDARAERGQSQQVERMGRCPCWKRCNHCGGGESRWA